MKKLLAHVLKPLRTYGLNSSLLPSWLTILLSPERLSLQLTIKGSSWTIVSGVIVIDIVEIGFTVNSVIVFFLI